MNETGSYPGQPWLWLYTLWYQVPGWTNSANIDMIAVYMTGAGWTILLLCVPFIPGPTPLRDIPRLIPVHRLIWRLPGRTTGAIADRVASQVSLACAPRPPGLRRRGTRNPATPAHPQRHPCRRGADLRRPGRCPPGTAPPPDRWDVHAAPGHSPAGRARATSLGVGCDPRLRHGQRRGFWDSRLESGSPTAPARPPTTFRQVALALLCRARRIPGNPRLAPVETPSAIHDPIAPAEHWCTGAAHCSRGGTTRGPRRTGGRGRGPSSAS
jgi:hypothetical protein